MERLRGWTASRPAAARRAVRAGLAALVLLAILTPTIWSGLRSGEEAVLREARRALAAGEPERADQILERSRGRVFLTPSERRAAAELYCRLGRDQEAQRLLTGLEFHEANAEDRRLREWGARLQKAAVLLRRAEREKNPEVRLRLAREAWELLPEAPRLLERVVLEELQVLSRVPQRDQKLLREFEEDYAALTRQAPKTAARVKAEVARRLETDGASPGGPL
ncbi:MAG: hypothetical protein FJX77_05090 [Armatimonadetes bacterium]|nr:hypothetical protein [Armatimonadota bacterium]